MLGWCLTPLDNKLHPFKHPLNKDAGEKADGVMLHVHYCPIFRKDTSEHQHMIKGSQTPDQPKVKLGPVMMLLTIDQHQTEGQT